jgi:hypothetical protein
MVLILESPQSLQGREGMAAAVALKAHRRGLEILQNLLPPHCSAGQASS